MISHIYDDLRDFKVIDRSVGVCELHIDIKSLINIHHKSDSTLFVFEGRLDTPVLISSKTYYKAGQSVYMYLKRYNDGMMEYLIQSLEDMTWVSYSVRGGEHDKQYNELMKKIMEKIMDEHVEKHLEEPMEKHVEPTKEHL